MTRTIPGAPTVLLRFGVALGVGLAPLGCYVGLDAAGGTDDPPGTDPDESDGPDDDDGQDDDDGTPADDGPTGCTTVGPAVMREMTRREYDRTVQALLFTEVTPSDAFVSDAKAGAFPDNSGRSVVEPVAQQYQRAAEALAAAQDLTSIVTCTPTTPVQEAACARQFVTEFGARAYRRPLTDAQVDRLVALYDAVRDDPDVTADFDAAIRVVLQAMLQSPFFLYHVQWGDPARIDAQGRIPLTDYELAARLSYFLWGTMPDDALLAQAADGALSDPAVLEAQARRMLDDGRTRETMATFLSLWLDVDAIERADKVDALFPEFDAPLQHSMKRSLELYLQEVVLDADDATLQALLTTNIVYADQRLAPIYGLDAEDAPTTDAFARIEDPPSERTGILGQAGLLAAHAASWESSPLYRGLFVYERFMCGAVQPPPGDIEFPEPVPGETPLEHAMRHMNEDGCNGCHGAFDPVGLGMEQYDSLGRFREQYAGGQTADDVGNVQVGLEPELLGSFTGIEGLTDLLLQSQIVHTCVARQAMRFAIGNAAEGGCIATDVGVDFRDSGGDLHALLIDVVRSDGFRFRWAPDEAQDQGGQ